jgi:hypothetical protein
MRFISYSFFRVSTLSSAIVLAEKYTQSRKEDKTAVMTARRLKTVIHFQNQQARQDRNQPRSLEVRAAEREPRSSALVGAKDFSNYNTAVSHTIRRISGISEIQINMWISICLEVKRRL